jgi:hypothetical protein
MPVSGRLPASAQLRKIAEMALRTWPPTASAAV